VPNCAFNLLAKADVRAALADEIEEHWPEVSRIGVTLSFSGIAVGLTWATSGPDRLCVWPSGEPQGKAPSADPGEEVTLGIS